jgi:adenylate cyclase
MSLAGTDLASYAPRHTKVLMVMDVVESVRLMEVDEDDFVARWQALVAQVELQVLPLHGGRIVKSLGDGLMLEFADAQSCMKAGFAIQDICALRESSQPASHRMHLRIGAHHAGFVSDRHDIYGSDVNLTSRVATLAGPGEIVATAQLRDQLVAGLDADVQDLGECFLKHVALPIRAFRVSPLGQARVSILERPVLEDLRPTLAVIPFTTSTNEPGNELLGEALADEVIAALSKTPDLDVISRLSTTAFGGRQASPGEISRTLGANYIVSGRCRNSGQDLALYVELVDARTEHVVWADNFRAVVKGLFLSDGELVARIVAEVSSRIISHQLQRARHHALPNLEGYTLLLGAIASMHRNTAADFDRARQFLEHLVDRSPRHPIPQAWLAKWHVLRVQQGWSEDVQREAKRAFDTSSRALDNDPECAWALTVDGLVRTNLLNDLDGALQRYEQALQYNPNESLAWLLRATMHAFRDEGEMAGECAEKALRLSPLDPLRYFYDSLAATAFLSAGNFSRAMELAQHSLRANRMHTSTLRALAISQGQLGLDEECRSTVAELLRLEPGFRVSAFMARSPARHSRLGQLAAETFLRAGAPK